MFECVVCMHSTCQCIVSSSSSYSLPCDTPQHRQLVILPRSITLLNNSSYYYCGSFWFVSMDAGEPRGNKKGGVWPYTNEFICLPNTGYSLAQQQQFLTWDLALCLLEYVVCTFNTYHVYVCVCVCVCVLATDHFFPNKTPTTKHHEQGLSQAQGHLAVSTEKNKSSTHLISPNYMHHP